MAAVAKSPLLRLVHWHNLDSPHLLILNKELEMHTGCRPAVKLHCQGGKKKKKAPFLLLLLALRGARLSSADGSSGPRALTVNDLPQNESAQQR